MTYNSDYDPSNLISIKASESTADNNGQTIQATPATDYFWPFHHSDLRCVYGKDSDGFRDSCIVDDVTNALWTIGSTFDDAEGNTYTVYGRRNERYRTRDLK
jgi:hypothetical protein